MNPLRWAQRRFRAWLQYRLQPKDSQMLHQRNIYIVPTAPGIFLALTLLLLLVTSINFQLSLG